MAAKGKKTADDQSKLFIQTARELGCEEGADMDDVMRRLAAQKKRPPPKTRTSKARKKAAK